MAKIQEFVPMAAQVQKIDHLTENFYLFKGFDAEHYPNVSALQELFFGDGHLVDSSYEQPLEFTLGSFTQALMKQIEAGLATFFVQQEIADNTQIFGNIAQRLSVYEYTNTKDAQVKWKRGINMIQYIFREDKWSISAMIWQDETADFPIPENYLS